MLCCCMLSVCHCGFVDYVAGEAFTVEGAGVFVSTIACFFFCFIVCDFGVVVFDDGADVFCATVAEFDVVFVEYGV